MTPEKTVTEKECLGFSELKKAFLEEVGQPEISPLTPWQQKAADAVRRTANFLSKHLPKSEEQDKSLLSTWGIYARLNLLGKKPENDEVELPQAKRFGHQTVAKIDDLEAFQKAILKPDLAIQELAYEKTMQWFNKQGRLIHDSERIQYAAAPFYIDLITKTDTGNTTTHLRKVKENTFQPVVLVINQDTNLAKAEVNKLIKDAMDYSPFVVVIALQGEEYVNLQILTNHEGFDGAPAGILSQKILEKFGLVEEIPTDRHLGLKQADAIENAYADSEPYKVKSTLLTAELSHDLYQYYQKIVKANPALPNTLNFENFLQVFTLASNNVNGKETRGGVLKFDIDITKQLDHFNAGNIVQALAALEEGNTQWLQKNGYLNQGRFGLFRPGQSNIQGIIDLVRRMPEKTWEVINRLTNNMGLPRDVAGQIMCSMMPREITKTHAESGENVHYKIAGWGSPALASFQEAAYTFSLVKGSLETGEPQIIVKRKYRAEVSDSLEPQLT